MKKSLFNGMLQVSLIFLLLVTPVFASQSNVTARNKTLVKTANQITETSAFSRAKRVLFEGNQRFITGKFAKKDLSSKKLKALLQGQKPFAVIVSCSDSRVPPELIFDQGLGDLFVIRVAGNVVDKVALGSIEYAVEHLKAPLVVVMGHEKCGAVKATAEGGEAAGSIGAIVEKIKPSLIKVKARGTKGESLIEETVNENVKAVIRDIEKSSVIKHAIEKGEIKVIGAKYHLSTGKVQWLDSAK